MKQVSEDKEEGIELDSSPGHADSKASAFPTILSYFPCDE